ncbi:uncharacterized protein [Clytia hemisphaerica]
MKVCSCFLVLVLLEISRCSLIQNLRKPEPTSIEVLQFSPGGADFYERYILKYKPLLIQDTVNHWPAIQKWGIADYLLGKLKEDQSGIAEKLKAQSSVSSNITNSNPLSDDVFLPLILQCEEFVPGIRNIRATFNTHQPGISSHDKDILLIPLLNPINVFLFGSDKIFSAVDIEDVDFGDSSSIEKSHLANTPYQVVIVKPGDLLYIPKMTLHHMEPESENLNFLSFHFDCFNFERKSIKHHEEIKVYKDFLAHQDASQVTCKNNRIPIRDILKIDLKNFEKIMHLRIPRRNKKPEDVKLASGYKMPVLGLGTALLNETTYDSIKYALQVGYRLFDLAYGYPLAEVSFAKAMAESDVARDEVFVVTKLHPRFLGYNETLKAIDLSLESLNISYIDLYLVHSKECDEYLLACEEGEPKGDWKDSWRAMEQAVRDGKIRSLGFSNIYHDEIYELLNWSAEPVSVIQNWFDPLNQDRDTREICTEYNIRYMGFSTLGSRWKLLGLSYNPILESDTITGLAGHYDYVVSHVILRWAIHVNVTVIPRSSNPKHISQNFRSLDISLYDVDIEEMNAMESIMKDVMELEAD